MRALIRSDEAHGAAVVVLRDKGGIGHVAIATGCEVGSAHSGMLMSRISVR
jgi:hypothetical protein